MLLVHKLLAVHFAACLLHLTVLVSYCNLFRGFVVLFIGFITERNFSLKSSQCKSGNVKLDVMATLGLLYTPAHLSSLTVISMVCS